MATVGKTIGKRPVPIGRGALERATDRRPASAGAARSTRAEPSVAVRLEGFVDEAPRPETILRGAGVAVGPDVSVPALIEAGLPATAVSRFAEAIALPPADLAKLLGTSTKTIARKLASDMPFDGVDSDRAYRLFDVTARAVYAFGDVARARRWLFRSVASLGGRTPIEMLHTEPGTHEVLAALDRIEFGGVA